MMIVERPRPVSEQVNHLLRQRLRAGEYPAGGRLPSESELAQELGVSRATVRSALATMAAEGLVIRRQGDGTFVNERVRAVNTSFGGMLDFSRLIEGSGFQASIQPVATTRRRATAAEAEALATSEAAPVLSLTRLFRADGRPCIVATNVVAVQPLEATGDEPDGRLPLHQLLSAFAGSDLAYAIYNVRAARPPASAQQLLETTDGRPLLRLTATFYDGAGRPLALGESYYNDSVLPLELVQAWG
jgi:GntR family transcriptional regulator